MAQPLIFRSESAARKFLEKQRWPDDPVCPFCEQQGTVKALPAKGSMGAGWYHCRDCRKKFTVRVGTLYERSHVPLHLWLYATHLMCASKKGMSAHQLHRLLGVTYKTAWFMAHRIREGMRDAAPGPVGGANKIIEADETFVGGKAKNRAYRKPRPKEAVMALVEREGQVRASHLPAVTAKNVREAVVTQASRKSYLMTDESPVYTKLGSEFAGHGTVNHSIDEYVRGGFWHTNTAENYFSIFKRGIYGVYHHVSPQHLKRYLGEFDFRYNARAALGVSDAERTAKAIKGIEGKRLTYRRTGERAYV